MSTIEKFDFSVDLLKALLWQYEDAQHLQALLRQKNHWYETFQTAFWQNWYDDVFNLDTANDFGLSVWAIILDVPISLGVAGSGKRAVWGFGKHNGNFSLWDRHKNSFGTNFGRDGDIAFALTSSQRRLILKLRYFQLISRGTISEINYVLKNLFGNGVYVLDGEDMSFSYVFNFVPAAQTLLVLEKFDLLPRPAGVKHKILIQPKNSFGFDPYYLNYNQGNFQH